MVPRQLHFFWCGKRLSWLRYLTLKSACVLNPDWDIRVWTYPYSEISCSWRIEQQDFQTYNGADWWPEVKKLPLTVCEWLGLGHEKQLSPVHLSDLFTWWVLYNHGGVYSDMDILYLRSLNTLDLDYDLIFNLAKNDFAIGFLLASPHQAFYFDMLQESQKMVCSKVYQSGGVNTIYQLLPGATNKGTVQAGVGQSLVELIRAKYAANVCTIPKELGVYPWNWTEVDNIFIHNRVLPLTQLGLHWFGGSKTSQTYNRLLTPETLTRYACTLAHYARDVA